jgi:hypothetical protein
LTDYNTGDYKLPRTKNVHRFLFRELNRLLKRNDYLKGSVYAEGEESSDDVGVGG